jgi:hypothetical protein
VPDISIPEEALRTMERAGQSAAQAGAEMAADLLATARPLVQGAILGLSGSDPAATDRLLSALS